MLEIWCYKRIEAVYYAYHSVAVIDSVLFNNTKKQKTKAKNQTHQTNPTPNMDIHLHLLSKQYSFC
jgi:hypothetical protein